MCGDSINLILDSKSLQKNVSVGPPIRTRFWYNYTRQLGRSLCYTEKEEIMVAGHLREKSGYYYAVLNYTDSLVKKKDQVDFYRTYC